MEHVWSVICLNYIIDKETGNLSLIGIPSNLGFKGEIPENRPFELPLQSPFFLVSTWRCGHDELGTTESAQVRVRGPNNQVIGEFEVAVDFTDSEGRQTYGKMDTVLFQENGVHRFEIFTQENGDWKLEPDAFVPLEIVHEQPESEEQESEPTE